MRYSVKTNAIFYWKRIVVKDPKGRYKTIHEAKRARVRKPKRAELP